MSWIWSDAARNGPCHDTKRNNLKICRSGPVGFPFMIIYFIFHDARDAIRSESLLQCRFDKLLENPVRKGESWFKSRS